MYPLRPDKPDVSVVVVVYNMAREAPRTLRSLSAGYQRHIGADDYEVLVVDNGSTPPVDAGVFGGLAGNFRLIRMNPPHPSPAGAVNRGLAEARGSTIGVMVDGARIVSPGLVHFARHGARLYDRAVVTTLAWHLGFDLQGWAIEAGYDQSREDALLAAIDWPTDGYRLFEIATLAGSSTDGWFLPIAESNALFLRRETWDALGGLDERFDAPGGGLVNLDTFRRALELPGAEQVILLGEGTFHQLHGGIATNAKPKAASDAFRRWSAQYMEIRGRPWSNPPPINAPTYLGTLPRPALAQFVRSALEPVRGGLASHEPPLGRSFDRELWALSPPTPSDDSRTAALIDLAHAEFRAGRFETCAAVARLARRHAPDEPEPQRLLSLVGLWYSGGDLPEREYADMQRALAQARRLMGDDALAEDRAAPASAECLELGEAAVSDPKDRVPER